MKRAPLFACMLAVMIAFGMAIVLLPDRDFSQLENRKLASAPALDAQSVLGGGFDEAMETYASDQFPLRDMMIAARAALLMATGERCIQDTLVGGEGWLYEIPVSQVTRNAQLSMDTLEELAAASGKEVTLLLVESSAQAAYTHLPALAYTGDQSAVIGEIYAGAKRVLPVSSGLASRTDGDALYYRTDHHLTALGAQQVYEALCGAWGLEPRTAQTVSHEGFLGSYYARVPSPLIRPEVMTAADVPGLRLTVDGAVRESLIDDKALSGRNKYAALIAETYAHAVIENDAAQGRLLILCDSYANAVAPLLAQHFARVDMIDPRYFTGALDDLIGEADHIAALYGLSTFSQNRGLLLLDISEGENE